MSLEGRAEQHSDQSKVSILSKLSDPTWHRSYSASTYYADTGNDTRIVDSESDIDSVKGLRNWMSEVPDSRTSTAEKALQRLKDLYGSRFCCELLNIRMSLATRKRRWYFFRRKRRAIVQACQYWTYGLDKKNMTICIGDAKFSASRHGFRATPSIRMFGRYLQEAGWNVIYIWEFNTSRVCSNCHLDLAHDEFPNAMCGLGEEADKFAYRHKAKSTFKTQRCTIPTCGRPWDHDRNAAWNIAYLGMLQYFQHERPLYFSKGLDNLPKYTSDNRAAINAAAQEVGAQRVAAAKEVVTSTLRARAMAIERGEPTVFKAHMCHNTRDDQSKASRAESARNFEYTRESVRKMVMENRLESSSTKAIESATKFAKAKKAEEKEMATKAMMTKAQTKAKTGTATAHKIAQPTEPSSVLARCTNPS
ncbi:hypothetical protein GGI08_001135 [Coemansia sp. S2]|nr:hypothetical protein GGI08_001135 [Coemansia sp. S2]KAJ2072769.1 hypothetical protein GGH13_002461 [Coemansia sp. S155-1]KAJ2350927.1 hypothetical protein GGH92_002112 [Coemansia sp. RSA 2673]